MRLILLGAPGAGKGTQGENISERYGIPSISTGNIIRAALRSGAEIGKKVKSYMDSGRLVPDEIVVEMLKQRIAQEDCKNGFILDGFPRNVAQANALEKMGVDIDVVLDIEVSDEDIEKRLSQRRVCECGASYHTEYNPPKSDNVCDKCGSELLIRDDDKPETIRERLRVYHEQTEPLKDYYRAKGKLKTVIGQEKLADTTALTFKALEETE
ncbi:MAG: adenylate kinase [Clostridia bacterium]|nr:adenylate kinase [Clostridia bacterium]